MKKLLAIILCLIFVLSALSGCGGKEAGTNTENETAPPAGNDAPAAGETGTVDWESAVNASNPGAYAADAVVLELNGEEVTWGELYPWVRYAVTSFEESYGKVEDMSAPLAEGYDVTYSDYILGRAAAMLRYYKSIEYNAKERGVTLSTEDADYVESTMTEYRNTFQSDDEYNADIALRFGDEELYRYMMEMSQLYSNMFEEAYGENGKKLSREEVIEGLGDKQYYMAKHILIKTEDEEGNPVSDEEKAEKYAQMEKILAAINELGSRDEKIKKFNALMAEYSEDSGMFTFPDGYLFTTGQAVPEFEKAALELEEYEFSGIVESDYGYHIILRLPIDVDATPIEYSQYAAYGISYPLRALVAEEKFSETVTEMAGNMPLETTEEYDNIDLSQVFPAG